MSRQNEYLGVHPCLACGEPCTGEVCDETCYHTMLIRPPGVVCYRVMQFARGPQTRVFYACTGHRPNLLLGEIPAYLSIALYPLKDVAVADQIGFDDVACDFCAEDS